MSRFAVLVFAAVACGVAINISSGCAQHIPLSGFDSPASSSGSSSSGSSSSGSGDDSGASSGVSSSGGPVGSFGDGSVAPTMTKKDGGIPCPAGLQCDVSCGTNGTATSITGKVYDPAGKNPLYNVAVYVAATPLQPLPKGVPTGADACSCQALFKSGALASAITGVDGSFVLTDVPVGNVTLVLQVGKWRRALKVTTKACMPNAQPDKSLTLPGTLMGAGPDDNMPDIAVSTGNADTLECLMTRIGVPGTEYVAGAATGGHVHIFSGGEDNAPGTVGSPEQHVMPGAPASSTALWANQGQLMPYDITLLSCEGQETYNANPAALEAYLNAGGRAFASHFHYAFFSGPINSVGLNMYTPTMDWGPNLSTWQGDQGGGGNAAVGGIIDQTLNGSTLPFPKGVALNKWLMGVNALGTDGVPPADVAIFQPRYNSVVMPANKPSQPWITLDPATGGAGAMNQTMYFSFDTPVNGPNFCGRAVFSDLHVAGNPLINDTGNNGGGMAPPGGCDAASDLSPQEKVLEFMLFDLSSCVISDTATPAPIVAK